MDMTEEIRACAVKVTETLARAGRVNVLSLAEMVGERSILVYQALGWLAREGTVIYTRNGTRVFVSLADEN